MPRSNRTSKRRREKKSSARGAGCSHARSPSLGFAADLGGYPSYDVTVTHELEAAALGTAHRCSKPRQAFQLAPAREIFTRPASEEIATILGMETRISGFVEETLGRMTGVVFRGGTARVLGEFRLGAEVTPLYPAGRT